MKEGEDGHSLPGQPYPKELTRHAFHRPRHRQHSSRTQLVRIPSWWLILCQVHCLSAYLWESSFREHAVIKKLALGHPFVNVKRADLVDIVDSHK